MSEEEIIKQIKDMIIAFDVQGYIRQKGFIKEELKASNVLQEMLDLYNKQKEEIEQKDIMIEAFKNAIGNILQGKKLCKEIKGGTTIRINLIKEKEKRIENALLYLKTMEETEDTYELEKILKGE